MFVFVQTKHIPTACKNSSQNNSSRRYLDLEDGAEV